MWSEGVSPTGLASLLLMLAALLGYALWRVRRARASLTALATALHRAEVMGAAQQQRLAALEALRESSQLAEHAIATGTAVVREVHKGIADIPFSVLEAIPATRASAQALRGLHDSISEGVYGAISGLNKAVGRELRKGVPIADATPIKTPDAEKPLGELKLDELPPPDPEADKKSWG